MKLTNKMNLPQPIFDAVANDPYDRGDSDISVTQLISPPRQVALKAQFEEEITEDCADRVFSLLGQLIHGLLERANSEGTVERRLSMKCEGWTVSGATDIYYEKIGLIQDYKLTTCYKFKNSTVPREHEEQLNLLAALHRANGFPVKGLQVVGILRDWSKLEALREAAYPQAQIVMIDAPLWPAEKANAFLRERVILHQQARVSLPRCSSEERWARPETYAVIKPGQKRAVRVYESLTEAENHVAQNPGMYIMKRPGTSTRCNHYCVVSQFCEQYRSLAQVCREKAEAS